MVNQGGAENSDGPQAKCCLGVAYFNRTLERSGKAPKCLGVAQFKHGEHDHEDSRVLSDSTGDFQYYCVGYSSHPTDSRPSRPGQPTQMPFCEGVEIAITEERVPAQAPAGSAAPGQLLRDRTSTPALEHGSGAPLPPASKDPSDNDRGIQSRFRKQLYRNVDSLRSALTGEKLPQLPVQLRKFDTAEDVKTALSETASVNLLKMKVMAQFITHRTMDAAKPIWQRFRSEEETE